MRWSVSPARVPDWNWNWTAVRPERYIFLNILVTVRDRLVTQPCHLPATTHYVPTTLPASYVAGHGRAVPTLYLLHRAIFLLLLFLFLFHVRIDIYIYVYLPSGGASSLPLRGKETLPFFRSLPPFLRRKKRFYGIIVKILRGDGQRDWIDAW